MKISLSLSLYIYTYFESSLFDTSSIHRNRITGKLYFKYVILHVIVDLIEITFRIVAR